MHEVGELQVPIITPKEATRNSEEGVRIRRVDLNHLWSAKTPSTGNSSMSFRASGPRKFMKVLSVTALFSAPAPRIHESSS